MTTSNREAQLLEAMKLASLPEQRQILAELDQIRSSAALEAEADRDTDLANAIIEDHLTPVLVHGFHSTATDWLGEDVTEYTPADLKDIGNTMRAEASVWYSSVSPAVKANRSELREQARGIARRVGSQYGAVADQAASTFMEYVAHLVVADGTDIAGIPSAADGTTNPEATDWSAVTDLGTNEGSPPPAYDAYEVPVGTPQPQAPAPAVSSAPDEPSDTAPSATTNVAPESAPDTTSNAADTAAPVNVSAAYESAQQRAVRRYLAVEEGTEPPTPGVRDEEQDGEAASSLPIEVSVSGHPESLDNFITPEPAKPAPSTRAPNVQGSRRAQAVATGPNPQGSFVYDPIVVEAKGYEDGFGYALVWSPGKPIPAALTSAATIGNKYNAEYVSGYQSGVADGIAALSADFQAAFQDAHKAQVLSSRKTAEDHDFTCPKCGVNMTWNEEGTGDPEPVDGLCPECADPYSDTNRAKTSALPQLQLNDMDQTVSNPFTWSNAVGSGAADVASVPTPGQSAADYPQPGSSAQDPAIGDSSTAVDPIIPETGGEVATVADPAKVEAFRRTVRANASRLGFSVEADDRPTSRRTAGTYGDTSPNQKDWANRVTELHKIHDGCSHCKSVRTRTGDPDAICGPHRDNMRNEYATSPASENYWTSNKKTAYDRENSTWDTNEVSLNFDNDYDLYQQVQHSISQGLPVTAEDARNLWGDADTSPNASVDVNNVDWDEVAADINASDD